MKIFYLNENEECGNQHCATNAVSALNMGYSFKTAKVSTLLRHGGWVKHQTNDKSHSIP